jgi:mono/diheme cytochrome c family protein
MSQLFPDPPRHRSIWRFVSLLVLCLSLGWGMAQGLPAALAQDGAGLPADTGAGAIGTVDPIPAAYQNGQTLYLKTCATCHIALPPAVFPTQTWSELIQDPEHYGAQLPKISTFDLRQIDQYLTTYSRSLRQDESTPYRLTQSRHFRALHPQVKLPKPLTIASCASCHPKADVFNFREWAMEN